MMISMGLNEGDEMFECLLPLVLVMEEAPLRSSHHTLIRAHERETPEDSNMHISRNIHSYQDSVILL